MTPDQPLARYTTFKLGGPCREFYLCPNAEVFRAVWPKVNDRSLSPLLMGGGSNLLVADGGLDSAVVRYVEESPDIRREGDEVVVSGGTALDDVARVTAEWGLDGMVMCSGIPGTVGGAIAGNAGAFGEQIGDRVVSVETMDRAGNVFVRAPEALGFAYRRSALPGSGEVVLSVRLLLSPGHCGALLARRREILALRAAKHPDWRTVPTAGSFFKNIEPTSKAERRQAAGWFLEQAGALTMRVGGARPFERHANIIIAEPGCRAVDVWRLSEMMAAAVQEKFGLALEREVKIWGVMDAGE